MTTKVVTAKALEGLQPKDKLYRTNCGDGLLLEVTPTGSKLWRYRYQRDGRDRMLALGAFPEITLKRARELRDEQLELLEEGVDPAEHRRQREAKAAGAHTFKAVAEDYWNGRAKVTRSAAEDSRARFELWVYTTLGSRDVADIGFKDVLAVIKRVEKAGKGETARRVRADISRVFEYAIANGLTQSDPTPKVQAMQPREIDPYPNPPLKLVAEILRAIDGYEGVVVRIAMQLLPRLLCRPGELRTLRWDELLKDEIRLSESRTKQGQPHIIPLSTQSKALFEELYAITGDGPYCFPSNRDPKRPMSDATINAALRRLGFSADQVVGHSFRKVGSTALHEQGFDSQWIERQLGHTDRDKIRSIYNHAQHLDARRKMMQEWSDFLDKLKSKNVVLHRKLTRVLH